MNTNTKTLTCNWYDMNAVEALLNELEGLPADAYKVIYNASNGQYEVEVRA